MNSYIPLRVYSSYSQGRGTVKPGELTGAMKERGIPFLPVCDPQSLVAWDRFAAEAHQQGQKPLLGAEIRLPEKGDLLLFPLSPAGYFTLVSCFNRRRLGAMPEVAAVFLPLIHGDASGRMLSRLRHKFAAGHFYLGLEWRSPSWLVPWARQCGVPLAWANPLCWLKNPDSYRVARAVFEHIPLQEALRLEVSTCGFLPPAAVSRRWGEAGREAMANTWHLAEAVAFPFDQLEKPLAGERDASLVNTVQKRLAARGNVAREQERARRELSIIEKMGFSRCFRIADEIAAFCRQSRIFFHLRGSGVSSFLLYLLGISRINPLQTEGLIFERFVSSLRDDLPDIDIDIDSSRRQEVLAWVFSRYRERVAFVSTHKFFGARSALYETARCAGYGPDDAHALTRSLPLFASPASLKGMEKEGLADLYHAAAQLEGVYKALSLHVGGVVFCSQPASAVFPLSPSPQGFLQMAWDKEAAERLKVFKLDLLGVRGFDVIAPVALQEGSDLFRDDGDVWQMIGAGKTVGCFQIESPLARETLERARPASLEELAISIAIIRPGPARAGMKKMYLERQPPAHPFLSRLFPWTCGALIFEEQVSILLAYLAGWDLETAEKVRGELKKNKDREGKSKLEERRQQFFRLAAARGWSETDLGLFWDLVGNFSLYAFCQAHSVAYAYSAYLSAWMKRRCPLTFFCRLLNAGGGYYSLPVYVEEARRWGIRILPPDVNCSGLGFSEEHGALRAGLLFVKGVGEKLAGRILEKRDGGYATLEDFLLRTSTGERELAALLSVGAFASIGIDGFAPCEKRANWQRLLGFSPGP